MDVSIEANYEVIRFIEHGSRCRPAMDCVPGELLIYRMKRYPEVEKKVLFDWLRQLIHQLELYHRCRNGQCYRYVNPFSVLVTKEDRLLLLDLEAESNEFVLRNMQKRAMRNHFVKPIIHIRDNMKDSLDLYGYGKTIQFILANVKVEPSLTKREEKRLSKIIEKCLEENPKKQYEELKQIQKELPVVSKWNPSDKKKSMILSVIIAGFLIVFIITAVKIWKLQNEKIQMQNQLELQGTGGDGQQEEVDFSDPDIEEKETNGDARKNVYESEKASGPEDGVDAISDEIHELNNYLLRNTTKDNKEVIEQGENLQRELLRYLSAAYDREGMAEQALSAYEMLCRTENQTELLKAAYLRRIALEMELQNEGLALQAGQEAVARFPELKESEIYQKLENTYGSLEKGNLDEEKGEEDSEEQNEEQNEGQDQTHSEN